MPAYKVVISPAHLLTKASNVHCALQAATAGGALSMSSGASATLNDTSATNNTAATGGAFSGSGGGTLTLNRATCTLNRAAAGGAVAGRGLAVVAVGASFANNSAGPMPDQQGQTVLFGQPVLVGVGGAVYLRAGSLVFTNASMEGNNASLHGGGMYLDHVAMSLGGCSVTGNRVGAASAQLQGA